METSTLEIIKVLQEKNISLFSLADFRRLFKISNRQTLYKKIQRLEQEKLIEKLVKGKYIFNFKEVGTYEIANYLYSPSCISLESALSFYGIITGFPHMVTSVTTKKPRSIRCRNLDFVYSQILPEFYFGMEKEKTFLMATPEKALLDYMYFGSKGLRSKKYDEMDFSSIDREKLALYAKMMNIKKLPL
ncbi:MAG: hypothetical protein M1120_03315 [Patescibacteria group bacterium]|nr:hypothetical protein [Patescibacteria group bacterium]